MSEVFLNTARSIVDHLDNPNMDDLAHSIQQAIRQHEANIQKAAAETVSTAMQSVWDDTSVSIEVFSEGLKVCLAYDVDAPDLLTRTIDLGTLLEGMAELTEPDAQAIEAVEKAIDALQTIRAAWAARLE